MENKMRLWINNYINQLKIEVKKIELKDKNNRV